MGERLGVLHERGRPVEAALERVRRLDGGLAARPARAASSAVSSPATKPIGHDGEPPAQRVAALRQGLGERRALRARSAADGDDHLARPERARGGGGAVEHEVRRVRGAAPCPCRSPARPRRVHDDDRRRPGVARPRAASCRSGSRRRRARAVRSPRRRRSGRRRLERPEGVEVLVQGDGAAVAADGGEQPPDAGRRRQRTERIAVALMRHAGCPSTEPLTARPAASMFRTNSELQPLSRPRPRRASDVLAARAP